MFIEDKVRELVARLEATGEPFEPISDAPWVAGIENRLGRKLPPSFRALVLNYSFPEFEIGGVTVFSNLDDVSPMDITIAPLCRPVHVPLARQQRLLSDRPAGHCEL
jgi:hypothetical protein